MQLRNIRRWQWIAIGLLFGAATGWVRHARPPNMGKYERIISGRLEFEDALLSEEQGLRRFRNLVVYPASLRDEGGSRTVHIVAGDYFDGKLETIGGNLCARWRKACFVAETPFRRQSGHSQAGGHGTVLNYLDTLAKRGVHYTYGWWRRPLWATVLWAGAGVLVIGLAWPTLVNLLVFGSIFRPREERGTDLSKVRLTQAQPAPAPIAENAAEVELTVAALEAELAAGADTSLSPQLPAPQPTPVRPVPATALDAPGTTDPTEKKSYGKDEDDYYPTEIHVSSKKPG